ncbi:MAG: YciI-like protein [Candidatus Accumulibacter sp. BA-94]|nr:MAG: YciI-like protein [Candidatus Accumulibacter sp. BA-94]
MFYMIVGEDRPGSLADRLAARPAHVERLQALQAEGRLLLAGPCPAIDHARRSTRRTRGRPASPAV